MMKNNVAPLALIALACALFMTACPPEDTTSTPHTDPSFLVGNWNNGQQQDYKKFSIKSDYSFVCSFLMVNTDPTTAEQVPKVPVQVKGKLDYSSGGLGPNDYRLRDLAVTQSGDEGYDAQEAAANQGAATAITAYANSILVTLTPSGNDQFVLSSTMPEAQTFFGGTFNRQQ